MTLFLDPPPPSSITSHVSMKLLYLLLKYFASHYPKTFYLTLASFSKPNSPRLIPRPMVPNQNVTCSTPLPPKRHNDVIMEKIVWRRPLTRSCKILTKIFCWEVCMGYSTYITCTSLLQLRCPVCNTNSDATTFCLQSVASHAHAWWPEPILYVP